LANGTVQGDLVGGTRRFLAIPYAKPPVGDRRWKAPEPAEPWTGTRHSTSFGSPCPQAANIQTAASNNEDCLFANVWAPNPAPQKAPVMVWIHGGGNFAGSAGDNVPLTNHRWYDGQEFARRHGIVLVSFNYRLGVMGFFSHPDLAGEGSPLGNQGLLDQRRLFQWVHDNIAAFGGDPGNVMIFGESAGSADVCYHIASPGSRGLFQRAASESGGCTAAGGLDRTAEQAAPSMRDFARKLGCDGAPDVLACLRAKPVADILQGGGMMGAVTEDGPDGVLPVRPRTAFERGDVAKVPYIIGANNEEGKLFDLGGSVADATAYRQALQQRYPGFADQVEALYPASRFGGSYKAAMDTVVGDSMMVCGTQETARIAARAGLPVYSYTFDIPWNFIAGITSSLLGATHASEISHVFGTPMNADAQSKATSDAMNAYWSSLAATGDPNYRGAPVTWPKFAPDQNGHYQVIQFAKRITVVPDFKKTECDFWTSHSS
jgi:para-nitrobenzyl esterase